MVTDEILAILVDILVHTDRPDKISIRVDAGRNLVIEYDDLDDEWCREIEEELSKTSTEE